MTLGYYIPHARTGPKPPSQPLAQSTQPFLSSLLPDISLAQDYCDYPRYTFYAVAP